MWYHYAFSTRPVYTYTLTAIGVGKGGEVLPLVDSFISKMFISITGGRRLSIIIGSRRGNREKRKIYNKINVFGEIYFTYDSILYRNYDILSRKLRAKLFDV